MDNRSAAGNSADEAFDSMDEDFTMVASADRREQQETCNKKKKTTTKKKMTKKKQSLQSLALKVEQEQRKRFIDLPCRLPFAGDECTNIPGIGRLDLGRFDDARDTIPQTDQVRVPAIKWDLKRKKKTSISLSNFFQGHSISASMPPCTVQASSSSSSPPMHTRNSPEYESSRKQVFQIRAKYASTRNLYLKDGGYKCDPDGKAYAHMQNIGLSFAGKEQILGTIPAIEVFDVFNFRLEMSLLGLHRHFQGSIAFVTGLTNLKNNFAVSMIVSKEDIEFSAGDTAIYTAPRLKNSQSQGGNMALQGSIETGLPVRIIFNYLDDDSTSGRLFRYEGLFTVQKCSMGKRALESGKLVPIYKYVLRRSAEQPTFHAHVNLSRRLAEILQVRKDNLLQKKGASGISEENLNPIVEKIDLTVGMLRHMNPAMEKQLEQRRAHKSVSGKEPVGEIDLNLILDGGYDLEMLQMINNISMLLRANHYSDYNSDEDDMRTSSSSSSSNDS